MHRCLPSLSCDPGAPSGEPNPRLANALNMRVRVQVVQLGTYNFVNCNRLMAPCEVAPLTLALSLARLICPCTAARWSLSSCLHVGERVVHFILVLMQEPDVAETMAHYLEFSFEIISASITFAFCIDNKLHADEILGKRLLGADAV